MKAVSSLVVALSVVGSIGVAAQQPQSPSAQEALLLAQGFGYLSSGDVARAAAVATQVMAQFPLSEAGVALAVAVELPRSGWMGALSTYEQWLGARKAEDPYVLRRIARACLHDALGNVGTRPRALEALIADGDQEALAAATAGSAAGKFTDTEALATAGDEKAVKAIIAQMDAMPQARGAFIDALSRTHSRLAVPPLMKLLDDQDFATKARAADALGKIGARESIDKLRSLLDEKEQFSVRFSSAEALARLGDTSGVTFLRTTLDSNASNPAASLLRVQAAAALALTGPESGWMDTSRALLNDPQSHVRVLAAQTLAPYDNATAKASLDALLNDPNPAIRQLAAMVLARDVAGDFSTLRSLIRSTDGEARVSAAARILEISR
ncbi:MAG TPA: HEAT repeat domain-containing protein [Vicinamibacterales bacterium]|nr:HEAT repeat domain-containing protein [Vicinamibacterales bacterium]